MRQLTHDDLVSTFLDESGESFLKLIARYEVQVFALAMNLLGQELAAQQVVERVFVDLHRELRILQAQRTPDHSDDFNLLVHRLTYDHALSMLVADSSQSGNSQKSFSSRSESNSVSALALGDLGGASEDVAIIDSDNYNETVDEAEQ